MSDNMNEIKKIIGLPKRKKSRQEYDPDLQQKIEEVRQAAQLLRQQRRAEKESGIRITEKFRGLPR